jgi:anaerobic magnesium-protoporphyrin IX monomethyl ester cyclase
METNLRETLNMEKCELLLISVLPDSHRSLSCLSLYGVAAANTISVRLLFIPRKNEYNEIEFGEFLTNHGFDVVGISVTTGDFTFCCLLTEHIRKYLPKAHVVWGGIHPLSLPEECLQYADSICIGEGEITLLNLLSGLRNQEDLSPIPGIGFKKGSQLILNPPPPVQHDLSALPFPYYDFENFSLLDGQGLKRFNLEAYARYSKHQGEDYTVMTSRSCPYRCAFCINSFLNRVQGSSGLIRRRSVDHVLQEISYARSQIPGIGFINFIDDHFLTDKKWTNDFCEKYKEQIGLPFMIRAVPETIKEDAVIQLKDAGLTVLQTGVQSGSERIHKTIFHRSFNKTAVLQAADVLRRQHIKVVYDFIIENDFETDVDRDLTIELLLDLPKPYEVNLFVLTVFPKTDLETMYKERQMKSRIDPYKSDYLDYNEQDFYYQLASLIPLISKDDALEFFQNRQLRKLELENLYQKMRPNLRNIPKEV